MRRILCVGRNYAAHRREMGGDDRDPPFFFAKPADAIVPPGAATSPIRRDREPPPRDRAGGGAEGRRQDVPVDKALDLVFGYAVGVDLTRRDLQNAAKDKGQPWDAAKGFDHSAPISRDQALDRRRRRRAASRSRSTARPSRTPWSPT